MVVGDDSGGWFSRGCTGNMSLRLLFSLDRCDVIKRLVKTDYRRNRALIGHVYLLPPQRGSQGDGRGLIFKG